MTVLVTLTVYGSDVGPFDIYSNPIDGNNHGTFIIGGILLSQVIAPGYTVYDVPDDTTVIRLLSTGDCDNYIDIVVGTTTTTSSTSTSTTTSTSTSTSTTTTTTTSSEEVLYATWWTTGETANCGDPCGQQKYTSIGFLGSPLAISYFYNTSDLTANDYYAPGIGVIGYTSESFGNAVFTADLAIDGSMSNNAGCP